MVKVKKYNKFIMGGKTKCSFCKKKTGLIFFTCNCEGTFCAKHRYAHTHNCVKIEEKKTTEKKLLEKYNPKMEASTLVKF
jgi:predicted nucleic acid binding AN1-type Zn finger protein